jgi:hypothetical protein
MVPKEFETLQSSIFHRIDAYYDAYYKESAPEPSTPLHGSGKAKEYPEIDVYYHFIPKSPHLKFVR